MRTIFFRVLRRRPVNAGEIEQLGLLKENNRNGKHLFPGKCSLKMALNDDKDTKPQFPYLGSGGAAQVWL